MGPAQACSIYRYRISIVDISTLLKIDIDKTILENIDIDIDMVILKNIDIDIDQAILKNIDIDKKGLRNIDIDIDKEIIKISGSNANYDR